MKYFWGKIVLFFFVLYLFAFGMASAWSYFFNLGGVSPLPHFYRGHLAFECVANKKNFGVSAESVKRAAIGKGIYGYKVFVLVGVPSFIRLSRENEASLIHHD